MKVWRKQSVKYYLGVKKVPKGTPKAKRKTIVSKRFYGTLRLSSGKTKQVPLTEERSTSRTLLRRLQTEEDAKRANGADRYYDSRRTPLTDLLIEYEGYLKAKANTKGHVADTIRSCRKMLSETKATTIDGLDGQRVLRILATWRSRKEKPLSVSTSNHYLIAIKGFSRWLWLERKSPDDPLASLKRLNAEANRKRVRRPLTLAEVQRLTSIDKAANPIVYRGRDWRLTASDRCLLYLTAIYTGLRVKELRSLSKSSFDFEQGTLTLEASNTKNRKRETLPLHPILIAKLKPYVETLPTSVLWAGSWNEKGRAGKFFQRDLKRAGIPYRDESGRVADFHSLRHTFITSLAKAGVHPSKAQRLARHSTINLTMNVYTSLEIDDLRSALDTVK